jgi:hypothetical protein
MLESLCDWAVARFALSSFAGWGMMGVYLRTVHHPKGTPLQVTMPGWMPFSPAWVVPYLGLLGLTWFLPTVLSSGKRFLDYLLACVIGWGLIIPFWIFVPTYLPHPAVPEGIWFEAFNWLWTMDAPYNVMPCAHGVGPLVLVWYLWGDYPRWRWAWASILVFGLPSISLVWQHRPVDVVLGSVAALVGIFLSRWLRPQAPRDI